MLSNDKTLASTQIQKMFRGYQVRQNNANRPRNKQLFCDIGIRHSVMEKMKVIHSEITSSGTAAHTNGEDFQNPFSSDFLDFYDQVIFNRQGTTTVENLILLLQEAYHSKSMLCNDLALYLAILLRNDSSLPENVKSEIFVCKIDNHVFVCVGNPKQEDICYVADPWIGFLKDHNRGVLMTVQEYKAFLKANPNDYIRKDSLLKIEIIDTFTEFAKEITPDRIHNPINAYNSLGKTPLIAAIENRQTDVIRTLLESSDIDVNKVDKNGDTPLLKAIKQDDVEMVKLLLNYPKIDLNKKSPHAVNGNSLVVTPWEYACRYHKTQNKDAILDLIEAHPKYGR